VARIGSHHAPRIALERTASAIASARRAVLTDRYAINAFAVEWRWLADLIPIAAEWRDLAARALEPNVFYEPSFALAAAGLYGDGVGAVLVWSGTQPRQLLGVFPARVSERRYGFKLPVLMGWTHPYGPLGLPLVDRDAAEPAIAAWLAHLAADPALPGLLSLPLIAEDGPFATALERILQRAQMSYADFGHHQRALLLPGEDRTRYLDRALSAHRRRHLARAGRRLADQGALLFTATTEPSAVAVGIEDFFALEAAGWKGEAGTAAVDHAGVHGFFKTAVAALAAEGKVQVNRLLLDGRAIAAAITLRSAAGAWYWKIAYDEAFARFSPGMLLTAALTEQLADNETIAHTDSCAAPGTTTLDPYWSEHLTLCDRLIAIRPNAPFALARRLEQMRRGAIGAAKAMREQLRRRR
jgi:CelD/BcsL family acetyltransferase involved in cellulose biosynthesis